MSATARFQVLLASLCFGTTGTAQALGPSGLSPAGVGAGRILVGGGPAGGRRAHHPRSTGGSGACRAGRS